MNDKRSGPKRRALAAALAVMLLCGCTVHFNVMYDDPDALTSDVDSTAALLCTTTVGDDGSVTVDAEKLAGVLTLSAFTVQNDGTVCAATSTLACTSGEAKLVLVNTDEKTIAAEWPLDGDTEMTATLDAGRYALRLAAQDAALQGEVHLTLDGEAVTWEDPVDSILHALEGAEDALQSAFGDEPAA